MRLRTDPKALHYIKEKPCLSQWVWFLLCQGLENRNPAAAPHLDRCAMLPPKPILPSIWPSPLSHAIVQSKHAQVEILLLYHKMMHPFLCALATTGSQYD